ncbi:hypothetical protein HYW74_02680 [Candidatus Pacearchaeota archaeon]|nr:hypothetical protein [Candidatus Pacearchaeota archaeon]
MVSRQQKKEMQEYIASALEGSSSYIEPRNRIISGINSNYILIGEGATKGLVVMVDQPYPNQALEEFYNKALNQRLNPAFVFFKDGKTFFRSAMAGKDATGIKSKRRKQKDELGLKEYSNEELRRMISFRPEEEFAKSVQPFVQYYQPESDRLEQGIVSYKFEPVVFDYSHIPPKERWYTSEQDESTKLRIWTDRNFNSGKLKLEEGLLVSA